MKIIKIGSTQAINMLCAYPFLENSLNTPITYFCLFLCISSITYLTVLKKNSYLQTGACIYF